MTEPTKKKHPGGRPTKMTPDVISKLQYAFAMDCTVREACLYAGVSHEAYNNYCQKHPEFREQVSRLRETPVLHARSTVVKDLKKNPDTAKWYLERKRKKEFTAKQEVEIKDISLKLDV